MKPNAYPSDTLRFDEFEVDFHAGELRKHGRKIKLQDKPFQILQILLREPGRAVGREELVKQLWPEDTFVDFERGLNTAIGKLRTALGDSAEDPRYIQTVARRSYRFIGTVDGAEPCVQCNAFSKKNVEPDLGGSGGWNRVRARHRFERRRIARPARR